ncbi:unnamed protein product [Arctia plantaginis]|uniref:U-box domain-containing protein n=1 Tax=Arctia plantaginis TaxID=874455 RepID=A0A8S1AWE5_ARCPL|nr:unnamed protein product [Arctia plantaginis]
MGEIGEPTLLQTLRGHRGEVSCVDAAGALLVSGGGDRSLRLWRWVASRGWDEVTRVDSAHRYSITAARFAPGAVLLASAGVDGAIRVWCGRTLTPRRELAAPGAVAVRALCWAAHSRILAGHDDGTLCVWNTPRATLLARMQAHEGALYAVAAPARCALLLTACTDGVLKVFDLAEVCRSSADDGPSPVPLTWVDGAHDLGALCADATEEGGAAATGGHDAVVRVWRAGPCGLAPAGELTGHAAAVTALRWARGGALLSSASLDRTARLWVVGDEPMCLHVVHAHARYLTCVTFAPDLSYMVTGSNDKSVRMWSLGSLTLEDELEPSCAALEHFALGDLEGIEPLDESLEEEHVAASEDEELVNGTRRLWRGSQAHAAPINCISTHDDMVATASSDGWVRLYRWCKETSELVEVHSLDGHQYPAMAADFGASGALLLSAGLDGRACLWDVESGVQLRVLSVGVDEAACGEAGGGGVRGARVSPHRPPRLLLATDDGIAPLWSLGCADPRPTYVYAGHTEAVLCCAWSRDGRVAATGAASGELRVLAHPPRACVLHHEPHAHDLGVQSCDFAPSSGDFELPDDTHVLATAGSDSFIKLWLIETHEEDGEVLSATVSLVRQVEAHGGGAASVRWSRAMGVEGALFASAGADGWARVWRVTPQTMALRTVAAAQAAGAGGVLAVALLARSSPGPPLLVSGTLAGELAVWQLPLDELDDEDEDEGTSPALWGPAGVTRWIKENITRAPGSRATPEQESELIRKSHDANVTGSTLMNAPFDELLEDLGYGCADSLEDSEEEHGAIRARLQSELLWLRRELPSAAQERSAPHALLCPLSHRLLREPARAADGYTYERANILDWFIAADGAVSPVSARRLRNARALPNYALRDRLRQFMQDEGYQ